MNKHECVQVTVYEVLGFKTENVIERITYPFEF